MKKKLEIIISIEVDQKKVFLMRKILLSLQQANAQYPEVFFLEKKISTLKTNGFLFFKSVYCLLIPSHLYVYIFQKVIKYAICED